MAQVLIRNVPDDTVESYRQKAKLKASPWSRSCGSPGAEQTLHGQERVTVTRAISLPLQQPTPPLTLDDIPAKVLNDAGTAIVDASVASK